ncbi:hypothetical protein THIOSC15_1170001 [uncultured Thiomicrorhabdus sp.]
MAGFGKDGRGSITYENLQQALGTLGNRTAITIDTSRSSHNDLGDDFRIIKMEVTAAWNGWTAGEGPVLIGLASGELTVAEIAECLESAPSDRNSHDAMASAHWPVWPLGFVNGYNGETRITVEKTIRWTFSDPEAFQFFAYNMDAGSLTTGSSVTILAKIFGVWVT